MEDIKIEEKPREEKPLKKKVDKKPKINDSVLKAINNRPDDTTRRYLLNRIMSKGDK